MSDRVNAISKSASGSSNLMIATCLRTISISVLLLSIAEHAMAQQAIDTEAVDHALLERFAGSEIVRSSSVSDNAYRLVLGNMRRTAGRVVPERSQRVRGELTRITYEIPAGFTSDDVISFYQEQADDKSYLELFSCRGRDCGNSNYWANEVFGDRSLYGPERNQHYLALQLDSGDNPQAFAVVYVITRANRRLLAHVEVLESGRRAGSSEAMMSIDTLIQRGAIPISGIEFNASDELIEDAGLFQIATALRELEAIDLYVVAHLQAPVLLQTAIDRSLRRAELVRQALIRMGVNQTRLVAQGVGPLAPLCIEGNCEERVELVVQQQN